MHTAKCPTRSEAKTRLGPGVLGGVGEVCAQHLARLAALGALLVRSWGAGRGQGGVLGGFGGDGRLGWLGGFEVTVVNFAGALVRFFFFLFFFSWRDVGGGGGWFVGFFWEGGDGVRILLRGCGGLGFLRFGGLSFWGFRGVPTKPQACAIEG